MRANKSEPRLAKRRIFAAVGIARVFSIKLDIVKDNREGEEIFV
jgi:hypothetical protein